MSADKHLTIPGALEWDSGSVERFTIATLRYAGGSEHDVRYVSERDYDAALAREAALREELVKLADDYCEKVDDILDLQQRLTVAEQRVGELDQLVADQPSLYFEGCNFMGFNSDGSSPLEFSEGPIRKLISVRMIGWRCEGPRVAVNLAVMSCPPMESGLPITAYCAALKPTEEGEGS